MSTRSLDKSVLYAERSDIPSHARIKYRFELIREAKKLGDKILWRRIANLLVKACERKDLSNKVVDQFVEDCPDDIFVEVALQSPYQFFQKWKNRAERMIR